MGKRNYYNNAEPEVVQGTPFEETEAVTESTPAEPIMEAPAVEEKPVEKEKPKKEEKKVLSFKGTVRA